MKLFTFLFFLSSFVLSACSSISKSPEPEMAAGVYIQSGYEFYQWDDGLALMIWHDGTKTLGCSSSTNGQIYVMTCQGVSNDNNAFRWHFETSDGSGVQFSIDDNLFDLKDGGLFVIRSSGGSTEVRQLKRDLSEVKANAESVTAFGLSDPDVLEFMQAASEIKDHISDCVLSTIPGDHSEAPNVDAAQQALVSFFSYLHDGEYGRASDLYGGEYIVMRDQNPDIDPDDHAALFQRACTVNGLQCLEIRKLTLLDQPSPAEFRFNVEFANAEGSLFARGPCCGDNDPNSVEQTEFIFTVRYVCTGKYHILEMPFYVP